MTHYNQGGGVTGGVTQAEIDAKAIAAIISRDGAAPVTPEKPTGAEYPGPTENDAAFVLYAASNLRYTWNYNGADWDLELTEVLGTPAASDVDFVNTTNGGTYGDDEKIHIISGHNITWDIPNEGDQVEYTIPDSPVGDVTYPGTLYLMRDASTPLAAIPGNAGTYLAINIGGNTHIFPQGQTNVSDVSETLFSRVSLSADYTPPGFTDIVVPFDVNELDQAGVYDNTTLGEVWTVPAALNGRTAKITGAGRWTEVGVQVEHFTIASGVWTRLEGGAGQSNVIGAENKDFATHAIVLTTGDKFRLYGRGDDLPMKAGLWMEIEIIGRQAASVQTGFRRWRFISDVNNGGSATTIAQLQFYETVGGPDIAQGQVYYSNDIFNNDAGTYGPQNAFDGDPATIWAAEGENGVMLECNFVDGLRDIKEFGIMARPSSNLADQPRDFRLQYNDGAGWIDAATVVNETGWAYGELRKYAV